MSQQLSFDDGPHGGDCPPEVAEPTADAVTTEHVGGGGTETANDSAGGKSKGKGKGSAKAKSKGKGTGGDTGTTDDTVLKRPAAQLMKRPTKAMKSESVQSNAMVKTEPAIVPPPVDEKGLQEACDAMMETRDLMKNKPWKKLWHSTMIPEYVKQKYTEVSNGRGYVASHIVLFACSSTSVCCKL